MNDKHAPLKRASYIRELTDYMGREMTQDEVIRALDYLADEALNESVTAKHLAVKLAETVIMLSRECDLPNCEAGLRMTMAEHPRIFEGLKDTLTPIRRKGFFRRIIKKLTP